LKNLKLFLFYSNKVCEFGGNDCIKAPSIVDRTTTKYVNRLVQRVDAVYRHLRQRCDLPALPPLPKTMEKPKEMAKEKPKEDAKEKPKLLQKMRESKVKDPRPLGVTTKESLIKGMAVTAAPTTKTTTTTKATTKRVTTKKQQQQKSLPVTTPMITTARTSTAPKQSHPSANVRKKRKLIVFEINDFGIPVARVEYQ